MAGYQKEMKEIKRGVTNKERGHINWTP